ncbi:hypothetical protein GCM10007897_37150 [Sphingobium jiangsuense]|nr:hypothetical protein GCM10007897_37150 [Sphingobium jiangsuense]
MACDPNLRWGDDKGGEAARHPKPSLYRPFGSLYTPNPPDTEMVCPVT